MAFNKRLKAARLAIGLRQSIVEARCGWSSQGRLSNYERGTREPKLADILTLARVLNVRPEWLLTGELPQHAHDVEVDEAKEGRDSGEFPLIPQYSPVASMGKGSEAQEECVERHLAFRREWLVREGLFPDALSLIRAEGDSMEPTLSDGDMLLVDHTKREVVDGRLYAIRLDMRLYAKRLQLLPKQRILVKSDNPNVENIILDSDVVEEAEIIGRIVWVGRKM